MHGLGCYIIFLTPLLPPLMTGSHRTSPRSERWTTDLTFDGTRSSGFTAIFNSLCLLTRLRLCCQDLCDSSSKCHLPWGMPGVTTALQSSQEKSLNFGLIKFRIPDVSQGLPFVKLGPQLVTLFWSLKKKWDLGGVSRTLEESHQSYS